MKDPTEHLPEHLRLSISFVARGVAMPLLISLFACGGGQAGADGPQAPPTSPSSAASATASAGGPASAGSAGAATTTTQGLADAGDPQGAKLPDAPGAPSAAASGAAKPRGPHDHDPGRSIDDIKAIINAHRDEAQACYEKGLAEHPGIEGNLAITWTIDPKGNVSQIAPDAMHSDISEAGVIACISDVIKRIQFAPSPGGFESKAMYPFKFRHKRKAAQ